MSMANVATFQEVLEIVETLPDSQQDEIVEIVRRRRLEQRRAALADRIVAAREEYACGEVKRGSVDDLLAELAE